MPLVLFWGVISHHGNTCKYCTTTQESQIHGNLGGSRAWGNTWGHFLLVHSIHGFTRHLCHLCHPSTKHTDRLSDYNHGSGGLCSCTCRPASAESEVSLQHFSWASCIYQHLQGPCESPDWPADFFIPSPNLVFAQPRAWLEKAARGRGC